MSVPESVAIADLNGDGSLDLVTANRGSDDVSVLLGNGDGTFQAAQAFAAGDGPRSVAIADLDGDGVADLVTANRLSDDVSVLLGNGDGTFQAAQPFAAGDFLNRWRLPILTVTGRRIWSRPIELLTTSASCWATATARFRGRRRLRRVSVLDQWRLPISTATGRRIWSPPIRDSDDVSVLLGNGDGTFQAAQAFAAGNGS